MKTTIYELLGMIKDGKAPKKIVFKKDIYEYKDIYKCGCSGCIDYYCDNDSSWLFDDYDITEILNDGVEILDDYCQYQRYTGEPTTPKPKPYETYTPPKEDKIEKLSYQQIGSWALEQHNWVDYARAVDKQIQQIGRKINEIIKKLNKEV